MLIRPPDKEADATLPSTTTLLDAEAELKTAFEALHAGEPAQAAVRFAAAVQRDPTDAQAGASFGLALLCAGEDDAGLQLLERAHYLDPSDARFLFLYGLALEKAGQVNQARMRYEGVLRLNPGLDRVRQRLTTMPDAPRAFHGRPEAPPRAAFAEIEPVSAPPARPSPPASPVRAPFQRPPAPARVPIEPPASWSPPVPGFVGLVRESALLWLQRPLLWIALFALPNALAGLVPFPAPHTELWASLAWLGCLALGAGPALRQMGQQWLHGRPLPPAELLSSGLGSALAGAGVYAVLLLAPCVVAGAFLTPLPPFAVLLTMLCATAPFHALLAPALACSAEGGGIVRGIRIALRLAGRRTWLHLGVMVATALAMGGLIGLLGWGLNVTLQGEGDVVARLMQIAGVSAGESLWAALVTVCGHDALSVISPKENGSYAAA